MKCPECGEEVDNEGSFCGECGADMSSRQKGSNESFIDLYGSEPLPFASGRGEFLRIYGKLMGAIPLFGGFMKILVGISLWSYSISLKVLIIITSGADVAQRFKADFNYQKDNFYSGYNGEAAPPSPP